MSIEIEFKTSVVSHVEIRNRLRTGGARRIGRFVEVNQFFDSSEASLHRGGCGLRVRTATPEGNGIPVATLTFKGPRHPGAMKAREEIEVGVDDANATGTLLNRLGYALRLVFEKRRESWELAGGDGRLCRIELDELPFIGNFVEVEGPDEVVIRDVLMKIGLSGARSIRESYAELLASSGARESSDLQEFRF